MSLKAIIITFSIFFLNCKLHFGQTRLGTYLPDSSIVTKSSISGTLYVGIDNILQVRFIADISPDTMIVTTNNGKLFLDRLNYIIIPARSGKARIHLYGIKNNDTTAYGYRYFDVSRIPEPKLTLNTMELKTPCRLKKRVILTTDSLGISFSNDIIGSENWVSVTKFSLGYNYGGFYISHNNPSNKLSLETKKIITRIGPDRIITIRATTKNTDILKELPIYRITLY